MPSTIVQHVICCSITQQLLGRNIMQTNKKDVAYTCLTIVLTNILTGIVERYITVPINGSIYDYLENIHNQKFISNSSQH